MDDPFHQRRAAARVTFTAAVQQAVAATRHLPNKDGPQAIWDMLAKTPGPCGLHGSERWQIIADAWATRHHQAA